MKNYYHILRISRYANDHDIKRAYRRLAVVFHPDKNRSEDALTLFQEINEAHEVLSDPNKRAEYDQMLSGVFMPGTRPTEPPWHRDPAYRRRQQGYRPKPSGPSEKLLMMLHFLKYMRLISFIGLGWCGFMLLDYMLPFRVSDEGVLPEGNRIISWQFHHEPVVVVTDKGNQFAIPMEGATHFPAGSRVNVISSKMMNVLVKLEAKHDHYIVDSLATIYQNLIIAPIVLLIVSVAGLIVKQGIEFRFNIAVSILIVLGFNLLFLLFSIL